MATKKELQQVSQNISALGLDFLHEKSMKLGEDLFKEYKEIVAKSKRKDFDSMKKNLLVMERDVKKWINLLKLIKKQANKVKNATRYTPEAKENNE